MGREAGGDRLRGIGARLRAARERRGLTVLQAAEKLHVDARILEALEAEDFTSLGAEVYVRGHLRRYAEAVGESAAQLKELYGSGMRGAGPDLARIPHGDSRRRSSPLLLPGLLIAVGAALGGLLWWFHSLPAPAAKRAAIAPPAAAAAAETAVPEAQPGLAAAAPAAAGSGSVSFAARRGQAQLGLHFAALSWVEISDADGRRLLSGLFARGATRDVSGTAPLRVVLGNATAVDLQLNGHPVSVAGLVHGNGSAYVQIDAAGQASAAAPRLAHGY